MGESSDEDDVVEDRPKKKKRKMHGIVPSFSFQLFADYYLDRTANIQIEEEDDTKLEDIDVNLEGIHSLLYIVPTLIKWRCKGTSTRMDQFGPY